MSLRKKVIEKIVDDAKIAEIALQYFWKDYMTLRIIYENIINYFYKVDKSWKFKKDLELFLQDYWEFLLDKIFSWYSLWEKEMYIYYLSRLWMKLNYIWDKWVFLFTKKIYAEEAVATAMSNIQSIQSNFISLKDNVAEKIKSKLWENISKILRDNVINKFLQEYKNLTKDEVERNYSYVIDNLLNEELIIKYKKKIYNNFVSFFRINFWIESDYLISNFDSFLEKIKK